MRNDQDHIAHLPTSNVTKDEVSLLQKNLDIFIKTVFVEHRKYYLKQIAIVGVSQTMSNNNQIMQQIQNFINMHGADNCYIGITEDIATRFRQHNLLRDGSVEPRDSRIAWFWADAGSENNARTIERVFLDTFRNRIHGGTGGGINPHNVYVYRIVAGVTNENV